MMASLRLCHYTNFFFQEVNPFCRRIGYWILISLIFLFVGSSEEEDSSDSSENEDSDEEEEEDQQITCNGGDIYTGTSSDEND